MYLLEKKHSQIEPSGELAKKHSKPPFKYTHSETLPVKKIQIYVKTVNTEVFKVNV